MGTTLPETNSKRHLKMDGWKTTFHSFPFGASLGLFSRAFARC